MPRILGPFLYTSGGAITYDGPSISIAPLLEMDDTVFIKLIHTEDASSVYLDLKQIFVFESGSVTYQTSDVLTFLNAWYVTAPSQVALDYRYGNPEISDTTDVFGRGFIRAFNPVIDSHLTIQSVSLNKPEQAGNYRDETQSDLVISGSRDLSNTLVCINGVFHNTIYWNKSQYVIDGMYSIRQTQKHDIVCYDTTQVGGHTVVPITRDMCVWDADQAGIILTLPKGLSFSGKSVLNTVDGYLFYPGEVVSIVSDTQAFIHTARIPFISQWRHNPLTKKTPDIIGQNWSWDTPALPAMQTPPVTTGNYRSINQQPDLDLFVNARSVLVSKVNTPDFRFNRVTSPHSALILINKPYLEHQVITPYPVQILSRYGVEMAPVPAGISRYGCGLSPSYVTLRGGMEQTWIYVEPQDQDIDRQENVLNPGCVPILFPQLEESMQLPFSIHVLS